jgi:hypothetical protein
MQLPCFSSVQRFNRVCECSCAVSGPAVSIGSVEVYRFLKAQTQASSTTAVLAVTTGGEDAMPMLLQL